MKMANRKKKNSAADTGPLQSVGRRTVRFFEDQLKGEEALTFATAKRLFDLAEELHLVEPWRLISDTELVLVKDPESGEKCHCSVMGARGEVLAIHAYRGIESYRLFRKIVSGAPLTVGEFFGTQHSVTMELCPSGKLTAPDVELARAFGHPLKRGTVAPQFRAGRPGYRPWYPTEAEGKVLALCVDSVLALCEDLAIAPGAHYWKCEDVYPEIFWENTSYFRIANTRVRITLPPILEPPKLDEERLAKLTKDDYPVRGIIEVDEFYSGAPVGGKNERKACLRVVMGVDAENEFLYMVHAFGPESPVAEVLMEGVLQTIERGKFVPAEVRVNAESKQHLLSTLKQRLGFDLRIVKELPALEFAKTHLLQTLGDTGPLLSD
jgi:hypothetical protein